MAWYFIFRHFALVIFLWLNKHDETLKEYLKVIVARVVKENGH